VAGGNSDAIVWPFLGIVPLFVFGIWLLTVSTARSSLFIAGTGTAIAVGAALETYLGANPDVVGASWYPALSIVALSVDQVASAAFISMIATYPTGVPERRWQRIAVGLVWVPVAIAPLSAFVTPYLLRPAVHEGDPQVPSPFAVPALEWAAPTVEWILLDWPALYLALAVLLSRTFFGDVAVRARIRIMSWIVLALVVAWPLWQATEHWLLEVAVFVLLAAIPIAAIHGVLRYGAFDIAQGARARFVARSSSALIHVLYGIAVAGAGFLLAGFLDVVGAVLLTTLVAVALLPLRAWLRRRIHRLVFGDRDRQLEMLSELGARLERVGEPRDLLAHLAVAVRDGLDASWVRIRLARADGALADSAAGVAGDVVGDPPLSADLVHADRALGRIEVGPGRRGEYTDAEQRLLRTVAGQAAASVANVRLTEQLAEQLDELTASRGRLIAAQDDERRRLERDLHDGIQQDIVAQIAGLRLARNRLQRGELAPDELEELQDQARETLTELRELARGIHPPVLTDNGLVAAVESGVARYPIPLAVEADAAVRSERFSDEVEATAYYVVREALANTAKHAHATRASVGLAREDGHLTISITDDGRGIGGVSPASTTSGGLANIRDRVAALRGTVRVSAADPSGTTVLVDLPVDAAGG
jgi:signal transduction histidine kinase